MNAWNELTKIVTRRFSHPWMAMAVFIPLAILLSGLALQDPEVTPLKFMVLFAGGLLSWTLIEYFLHRLVFHWTDVKEPWKSLASGLHRAHHASAKAADLIIAPPVASLGFAILIYLLFALVTQSVTVAAVLETGVFAGYLVYEWVHFMSHRFYPRTKAGKYLRKYHLQHHFRDEDRQFGVTSPFWDIVFGTYKTQPVRHAASMARLKNAL